MFMYDRWLTDQMPDGRTMSEKDVATFTVKRELKERAP